MSQQPKHIYEFGPFRLDAAERLLSRDGEVVPLQPKVFDLLLALVERHGRLLEKDELMKAVWPDTIVEEVNLANNISILRKTLSENGERFIETAPKRGYRFVASVREIVGESMGFSREQQPESLKAIDEPHSATANGATAIARITPIESPGAWFRRHKRSAMISLAVIVVAAATIASFTWESLKGKSGGAINSIAVLPFANADPNTEYLSDGITESLINSLSQLPQLKVIARTTAFRYKGKEADPRTVGRDLDVDAVLTGKLVQQGNSLTIQAELVKTSDGAQMWGERYERYERYERKLADIFTVKEEIVRQISERLRTPLTGAERKQITKRHTENVEAYQHYMRGRYFAEKRTEESYQKAIEHYKQALDLDPNYALAYVGLADAYHVGLLRLPREEKIRQSRGAAEKALAIDETLSEAHTSLGRILWQHDWNWRSAEREFERAIDLDPGNAFGHRIYGYYLASMGQLERSIAEQKQAQRLDPLSLIINLNVGSVLNLAGETDEALAQIRKTQELDKNYVEAYLELGVVYAQKGMYAEAIAELNKADPSVAYDSRVISLLGYNYALWGKRDEAVKRLDELKELSKRRRVPAYDMAIIYTGLGEKDQAFKCLRQACEDRHGMVVYLKFETLFKSLRTDPRFADLLQYIGLPQ
jgi:TolB-like protein/DNA-binding winged helix-turn-helix (wHTH) protein/Flp pilus assembly protein TadD